MSIDFTPLAQLIVDALLRGLTLLVTPLPRAFEQWLLGILQGLLGAQNAVNVLIHNPLEFTTQDSDVITLFDNGRLSMLGIGGLVVAVQGIRIQMGKIELYEAISRVVLLVLLGESVLVWGEQVLNLANRGADAVIGTPINLTNQELPGGLELGAMLVLGTFFAALAWVKGAVGIVFLKLLLVVCPYFFPLSALPWLEGLGQWWCEEFTTWGLRPFLVALTLRLGLGMAAREGGPLGLLFLIVTFWLAYTMDGRVRRFSANTWGTIAQLAVFRTLGRLVAGTMGGPVGAAAAAGAP